MALASDLTTLGMPGAEALAVGMQTGSVTAAGTGATTATAIPLGVQFVNLVTDTSKTGGILNAAVPLGTPIIVFVASSETGVVYPPTGGTINGGATDAGVSIAQNLAAKFVRQTATKFVAVVSA